MARLSIIHCTHVLWLRRRAQRVILYHITIIQKRAKLSEAWKAQNNQIRLQEPWILGSSHWCAILDLKLSSCSPSNSEYSVLSNLMVPWLFRWVKIKTSFIIYRAQKSTRIGDATFIANSNKEMTGIRIRFEFSGMFCGSTLWPLYLGRMLDSRVRNLIDSNIHKDILS